MRIRRNKKTDAYPYSVLLLYPEHLVDKPQVYFTHVRTKTVDEAVSRARNNMRRVLCEAGCELAAKDLADSEIPVALILRGIHNAVYWKPGYDA